MKNSPTEKIISRLNSVLLRKRIIQFLSGTVLTAAFVFGVAILLSLLAQLFILPVGLKVSLLVLSGLLFIYFIFRFILKRMMTSDIETLAVDIEKKHPELKGLLIAAIQFSRTKPTAGFSSELIEASHQRAYEKTNSLNFNEIISIYPIFKTGRYLAISAALGLLLLVLMPGLFSYSYEVYSNPTKLVAPPIAYQLKTYPSEEEIVKYSDVEIGASLTGTRFPETGKIVYKLAGGSWQTVDVNLNKIRMTNSEFGDSLKFGYKLRQIDRSFDFYVEAGRVKSEIQKIDVVDRPRVNGIKLSIFSPKYTGIDPMVIDENNGSFSAVVGSRVNMHLSTNLPIQTAELVFNDSSVTPLKVEGSSAEISMVVEKSQPYHFRLYDHLGEKNPDPIEYYITAIPDENPSIDVVYPGYDVALNDDMMIPFQLRIFDDFGFTSLALKYQTVNQGRQSEEHVAIINYSDRIKTEGDIELNWDLVPLNIYPGDYVTYYFEIADNDRITGPKITKTRKYLARVPSLDEVISDLDNESRQRIVRTEDVLKSGKELTKRLKHAARKLQSELNQPNSSENWQNKKELESIAEQNSDLVEQIDKIADEMNKSLDKLNENSLMGQQIMEKMAELQKLYEEVATPEMKRARERLLQAMQQMDKDEMQKALKDFEMSQEELMERLERTLALLKQMQLEQKMEAMVRKMEELIDKQEQMNETTEKTQDENLPQLSSKESDLKNQLEQLQKQLDDLNKMQNEAGLPKTEEVEKFKESLEKNDAKENMQNMSESLSQKQKNKSSSEGKEALSKMRKTLDEMQQQLMAMQGNNNKKMEQALRNAIEDANNLSQNQEDLLKQAAEMRSQSQVLQDLAKNQNDLLNACNNLGQRINELGKKSPFLASELSQLLDRTAMNMEQSKAELAERYQGRNSIDNQREAMADLNKISLRLKESLDNQKECNKGGSCDKNTSDLQSLTKKQNQLNQQTQNQCNNPNGSTPKQGQGQEAREALQRLASEQGAIRKSLQELAREFGQSRQVLGRLDDIASEMKKVEESLANGETGSDITDRQIKIFSRMLEATRSLYRKDFSEQRQATSAQGQPVYIPPQLSNQLLSEPEQIESKLNDYLKGNYPPQYEEQIKAYFKALLKMQTVDQQEN